MGLDVYLYHKDVDNDRFSEIVAAEELLQEEVDNVWKRHTDGVKYEDIPESVKEEIRETTKQLTKAFAKKYGLSIGDYDDVKLPETQIEIDASDPEHLFKIGYFRSSYNSGGINSVLRDTLGEDSDLYYIFDANSDVYHLTPNWKESKKRCKEVMKRFKKAKEANPYKVVATSSFNNPSEMPKNANDVLKIAIQELKRNKTWTDGAYESRDGLFCPTPISVRAVILGTDYNMPTAYLVVDDNDYQWYLTALQIVIDTIDYVLSQDDPEAYHLHWSG